MNRRMSGVKTVAIIPAAGSGKRLKSKEKKPFVLLGGKPLIAYSLEALAAAKYINGIIIAVEAESIERLKEIINRYGFKKVIGIVKGGKTRTESVRNCFRAIDKPCDIVLIHDGARPFPETRTIRDSIRYAKKFGGCVAARPTTDTIKLVDKNLFVERTLDRKYLWSAQTPQTFRYDILKKALSRIKGNLNMTDDACVLERLGKTIKILKSSARNIKVTTKEDLKIAEALI